MPTTEITSGQEHILAPLCQQWIHKIEDAKKRKWDRFGQYAVEGMKFYDGVHNWMWKDEEKNVGGGFLDKGAALPTFRMQVNRMFEAVALFGPALYHRNPDIMVTPIDPPFIDPMHLGIMPQSPEAQQMYDSIVQQQEMSRSKRRLNGDLKQHYLNWLQVETDKKTHARRTITEAIIKGMGVMWTDMYSPPGSQIKYPFSHHLSVDDIYIDPDAEYWEDVQYIARYCCHPINLVEREYGLPEGSLKGHIQSSKSQGETYGAKGETTKIKRRGRTHDLIEYYKVYSKNGFGGRLRKGTDDLVNEKVNLEPFGDFCKIVVAKGVPFPLNVPTWSLQMEDMQQLFERVQWEIPFWTGGGWPLSRLFFYDKPRSVWPVSLTKAATGELRFINWCMSFLADKVAGSCQTYVAVAKAAGMEIQNQIKNKMAPYTVIEIAEIFGKSIGDVVSFLDAPNFSVDIWKMLSEVMDSVDKRIGLTDLVYGMTSRQLRSATEADIKEAATNIRPDDMASKVEDFLSDVALNECAAAVWSCEQEDVAPVLGDLGASVWVQQIQGQDFERVIRDYDYRVAAGSARKPNKNSKQRALVELGQVIVPALQEMAMGGQPNGWNAYITDVAECMDLDAERYLIEPPPEQEGPSPEEQQMQMEMQMKQAELDIKQAEFQLKQQQAEREAQLKLEQSRMEGEIDADRHSQEMRQDAEEHAQEMMQQSELHRQELKQAQNETKQELLLKKAELAMQTKEQELKLEGMKKMQAAQRRVHGP